MMKILATAVAAATIAAAAVPASAAPFGAPAQVSAAAGVETVGHKHRHHHHCHGCTAAAVGIGAFALGLAIASQPQTTVVRECVIERTKRWSPRHQAYVVREEKVCY
jgi:hypothetical protein